MCKVKPLKDMLVLIGQVRQAIKSQHRVTASKYIDQPSHVNHKNKVRSHYHPHCLFFELEVG